MKGFIQEKGKIVDPKDFFLNPKEYEIYRVRQEFKSAGARQRAIQRIKQGRFLRHILTEREYIISERTTTTTTTSIPFKDSITTRGLIKQKLLESFLNVYDKHDVIIYKTTIRRNGELEDIYIPFCLKCFRYHLKYFLKYPYCNIRGKTIESYYQAKNQWITAGKKLSKFHFKGMNYRNMLKELMKWFFTKFLISGLKCSNPRCKNPVHSNYIFNELTKITNIKRYFELLEMGIEPTFICCKCYDTEAYLKMKKVRGKNYHKRAV